MSEYKKQQKELEDAVLNNLANTQGSLLDNSELINTLEVSKEKSIEIEKSLE